LLHLLGLLDASIGLGVAGALKTCRVVNLGKKVFICHRDASILGLVEDGALVDLGIEFKLVLLLREQLLRLLLVL